MRTTAFQLLGLNNLAFWRRTSVRSSRSAALRRVHCQVAQTSALPAGPVFFLDEFAARQWDDPSYSGTRIPSTVGKAHFVEQVHRSHEQGAILIDGYAPFCKHIFVPNFAGCSVGALKITAENKHILTSGYTKRRPEELAVLTRGFPVAALGPLPEAKFLDIILYSRDQLVKEYTEMPTEAKGSPDNLPLAPWGIISIKAQDEDYELPMSPITIMRNALGRAEGGSGVPLEKEKYDAAVEYWEHHGIILA